MWQIICLVVVCIILLNKIQGKLNKTRDALLKQIDDLKVSVNQKLADIDSKLTQGDTQAPKAAPAKLDITDMESKIHEPVSPAAENTCVKPVLPPEPSLATVLQVRQKSKFEETVGEILKRIWNWILVGDEHRPKNVTIEYAVASTWLMRLGVIALVICIGYFLKWSIDNGLLGPAGRVAIAIIAGIGMLAFGVKNFHKKYDTLAQGLLGGGLAALYFSMYSAGPLYHLLPMTMVFGLMVLITVCAGLMAYRFNSQLVAIFGIIGGFVTPVILATPGESPVVLYVYMLILNLGIFGIAHVRNWRLLNYLGFVFTWLLIGVSLSSYQVERDFNGTIACLTAMFILYGLIAFYYNLIQGRRSTQLEVTHALLNAFFYSATAYQLILEACGRPWPAVMAVGVALFYIFQVYVFIKRRSEDRSLLVCLIGMAGFFTAWAIPLMAEKETISICWSLQAFFFLWIGLKLNSNLLVNIAYILYALVMGRLAFLDLPDSYNGYNWQGVPMAEYWGVFFSRIWTFGITIGSFFGAFVLYRRKIVQLPDFAVDEKADSKLVLPRSTHREMMYWGGIMFLFIFLYVELFQMFSYYSPLQMPVLTLLCCLLGAYVLYNHTATGRGVFLPLAILVMAMVLLKYFSFDPVLWASDDLWYIYRQGSVGVLMRFLDCAVVFVYILTLLKLAARKPHLNAVRKLFTVVGTVLLLIYASLETNTFFYWYVRPFQEGSISVVWALFAMAYLTIGLVRSSKAWRYSGLALFLVVVGKVFLFDLSDMPIVYRVVAFMILGVILMLGSFAYIKASKKFTIGGE